MKHVIMDETGMFDEKCVLQLDSLLGVTKEDVEKYNQCHGPGGKFCSSGKGGGAGTADSEDPGFPETKPEEPKELSYLEQVNSVTKDEWRALADYVGPDYALINAYSRNPNGPDHAKYEDKAQKIDNIFNKMSPLKGEEIVYRGMNPPKDLAKQLVKGELWQHNYDYTGA
jgi:hypothetical protein